MQDNKDKFAKMLDELASEYPEYEQEAMELQDALFSSDEELPEDDFESEDDFDFEDEDEELPLPKKPRLEDEEDEDEDEMFF